MYILPVILIKNKTSRNKVSVLESVFRKINKLNLIKNKYLNFKYIIYNDKMFLTLFKFNLLIKDSFL